MFSLYMAYFLSVMNVTSIKILLPEIMTGLGIEMNWLTWVVNAYTLPLAAFIPVAGRIGDLYGPRRFFLLGVVGLGLGSLLCGTAFSLPWLITGRVTQALGAAFLAPNSLTILLENTTPGNRGQILGMWNAIGAFGGMVGPVASGLLVDAFSWKSSFLIIAGLALILALTARSLWTPAGTKASQCREKGEIDYKGCLLLICAVALLLLSVTLLPDWGWRNPLIGICFSLFIPLTYAFYRVEKATISPLLNPRLFSQSRFTLGLLVCFLEQLVMAGTLFVLPIYFSTVQGFSASRTALLLIPSAFSVALITPLGGRLSDRYGPGPLIAAGMLLRSISFLLLSRVSVSTAYPYIAVYLVLNGAGFGLSSTPALNAIISTVTAARHGSTSGVYNMVRFTGAAAGTTLAGIILYTLIPSSFSGLSATIPGFREFFLFGAAACLPGLVAGLILWRRGGRTITASTDQQESERRFF